MLQGPKFHLGALAHTDDIVLIALTQTALRYGGTVSLPTTEILQIS